MVSAKIPPFLDYIKDVTITSVSDNELLAYDNSSSTWINQTPTEAVFDSIYLKLDGSNANTTIDIGSENFTTTGDVGFGGAIDVNAKLTLRQTSHDDGIKLFGFDTQAEQGIDLSINSTGVGVFRGLGSTVLMNNQIDYKFPDNKIISFSDNRDFSMGYHSDTNTFRLVDGILLSSNVRMTLDSLGDFDFQAGNLLTTGIITAEQLTSTDDITMDGTFTNVSTEAISNGSFKHINNDLTNTGNIAGFFDGVTLENFFKIKHTGDITGDITSLTLFGIHGKSEFSGTINNSTADIFNQGLRYESEFSGTNTASQNISIVGANLRAFGNIGTNGNTQHIALTIASQGTSDNNYGLQITNVSGGVSSNFAIYDTSGTDWWLASDNQAITFGATNTDLQISSDGTDGVIDTNAELLLKTGSSVVLEKTSGKGIKVDTATPTFGFKDILGDQFTKNTGGTRPTLTVYNGVINSWLFGVGDEAFITYHIPHDYVAGTPIFLHIHWSHIGTFVTGGTVTFKLTSILAKAHNQQPFQSTPSVGTFTGTASSTQYQQILSEVLYSDGTPTGLEIDTANLEPDSVIELTFEVDANDLTVSEGAVPDIFVHFVDIHYQSTNIATKDKAPDFYV